MANRILHPSVLWPNGVQDAGKRLPVGELGANLRPRQPAFTPSYPASDGNGGWLDEGLGKKVNLLA